MKCLNVCLLLATIATILVSVETKEKDNLPDRSRHHQRGYRAIRGSGDRSSSRSSGPSLATRHMKPLYTAVPRPGQPAPNRPNIILFLTDDQDVELGSLQFMPRLTRHLKDAGASYENGFVSTPMCCPSRSSLLTGLYVHNHKVFTNNDNCSSSFWQAEHETRSFAAYLQDSGYRTGYFGKYLNKYGGHHVPPGWGEWRGLIRNSRFYNYSLNINGRIRNYGFDYGRDYLPDVITNSTLNFLRATKESAPDSPFLAVLSFPGPHGPEDSAPQYSHLFFNVTTHHTPAYDFAPNPDKQWILRHTDKMQPIHKHFTDLLMTKRLQTLQSVDDAIERVVGVLSEIGELENTYIFYTSDHGYHLGQYGLVKGKAFPFDVDTKVPFLVRGPGVKRSVRSELVGNIDIAPTFLDIAGLQKPPHMDGESILPILLQQQQPAQPWRSSFLLERGKMTFERYAKVSNAPILNDVIESEEGLDQLLRRERLTKQERLEIECKKARYQAPCKPHQKWFCKQRSDRTIRMARCRSGILERMDLRSAAATRRKLDTSNRRNSCHCQPGEVFGWKYAQLESVEKKLQRRFLVKHVHVPESGRISQKFLKMLPGHEARRVRRSSASEYSLDGIFEDVAHEEIQEVDGLVEDIAEEIRDLTNIKNVTEDSHVPCKLDRDSVVCSNDVISNKKVWETSRTTIKHQIQRLRAQLMELKQIRKYLRLRRPKQQEPPEEEEEQLLPLSPRAYSWGTGQYPHQLPGGAEICLCQGEEAAISTHSSWARREEKKLEVLRRKERKRSKLERREKRKHDHCKQDVKMNCFSHDNNHWRTAPFWTEGPFCACTNSNNNTYWCVRNINSTHNYLYCEYVTGMITYFDLRVDPHQLRNVLHTLSDTEVNYMHAQVIELREYSAENIYLKNRKAGFSENREEERPRGKAVQRPEDKNRGEEDQEAKKRIDRRLRKWRQQQLAKESSN